MKFDLHSPSLAMPYLERFVSWYRYYFCIGGFTIPAAKMAKRVVAVEPVMTDELISNLWLNNMEGKVSVISSPLGNGSTVTASWNGKVKSKKSLRFVTIKLFAGGCDFLKCDCEGAEWCLTHNDLKDIRRIEMELHKWGNPNMGLIKRLMTTHETEITPVGNKCIIGILHARRREWPLSLLSVGGSSGYLEKRHTPELSQGGSFSKFTCVELNMFT